MADSTVGQRGAGGQERNSGPENATGDPTLRWEVARGWRLGRRRSFRLSESGDPFEKTECQDVRQGSDAPRIQVCLVRIQSLGSFGG
ncbi:hypothetical protein NSPZN2_11146 [Nitrospira defluvii]|uniref:Uncharacterized protein n=1 Tax=Nitrospira defluvii TaxID=330214 RepID=A0ABM8QQ93_9BACT|nr:hypothetical protein NSPZN2_11146 [Nitrospira defluvii]